MNADKIADLERKISGYRCAGCELGQTNDGL